MEITSFEGPPGSVPITFDDGTPGCVRAEDSEIVSAISGITSFTDSDGTIYEIDQQPAQERHALAVGEFKRSKTYRRIVRRQRAPRRVWSRGRARQHGARRQQRHVAQSTSSSDPGSDDPPPEPSRRATGTGGGA